MKKLFLFIICFLLLTKIAFSALIEVGISQVIENKVISQTENISFNAVKFQTEIYNTGSIAYDSRVRIFIYNDSKLIFDGWSQEKDLMAGDKETFDIYWYSKYPGKYEYKLRVYFGNEINETEKKEFEIDHLLDYKDVFEVYNFRTYDNKIVFDLKSKENVKNIEIIPYDYTPGWIFEQETIDEMKKDSIKTVSIPFYPTVWEPSKLTLAIVAEDGKFYSERVEEMKKEAGIIDLINNILNSLRIIL